MAIDAPQTAHVRASAERFAARYVAPRAADADHGQPGFPSEMFAQGVMAGFDRLLLPEAAGGADMTPSDLCALVHTLAKSCAGHALVVGVHAASIAALHACGADAVQEVIQASVPLGVVYPNPSPGGAGFEPSWDGEPIWAINAASGGFVLRFDAGGEGEPQARIGRLEANAMLEPEPALGLRALTLVDVTRAGVHWNTLVSGQAANELYLRLGAGLCRAVAAAAAGLAEQACDKAIEYARERYQGGRLIVDHAHVRALLGAMQAQAFSAAAAVQLAARRPASVEAAIEAKIAATDAALRCATDAVQVLGGYGYMRGYGLEKAMRDAAVLTLLPISNLRAEMLSTALRR